MRIARIILLLPALVAAENQIPLMDKAAEWLASAKSYIPTGAASPIDAGAAKVASKLVEKINYNNWQRKLSPSPSAPQEMMLLLTGGNKTCPSGCVHVDQAWNVR